MFFAKEMNYLATRMAVIAKTNALMDILFDIPLRVLGTDEGRIITDSAIEFDDTGFDWYVPSEKELIDRSRKKVENGEGFYETRVRLEVSQEYPRFATIKESLNASTKIYFYLTTVAFDKDEEVINKDAPIVQEINLEIIIDKNGAHIDERASRVNTNIEKFKELVPTDTPLVDRKQLADFFNETLKAIDAVNGTEGYFIKLGDREFNAYGITFDEDGLYYLEDKEKFNSDK
jgi:hypothetical protein